MGNPVTVVATKPVQGAGSVVQFSFDDGTTYKKIPYVEQIPQVGTEGEFVDVTPIDELVREYIPGIRGAQQWIIAFRDVGADPDQDSLIDAAQNQSTVKARITYSSGRVADFSVSCNGHYAAEVGLEAVLMHAVKGQITGDVAWSKVVAP